MAYYLVRAKPVADRLDELEKRLANDEFLSMQPFGQALTQGLRGARKLDQNRAVWEEEDYCSPPLAMERAAVLDTYFDQIEVEHVARDEGWQQISDLPYLFP